MEKIRQNPIFPTSINFQRGQHAPPPAPPPPGYAPALCDDINAIWERLSRKYRDEGKLIDLIMADIKSMKRTYHTPADVLKIINTIEKAHHDLTLLGKEKEISNVTIVAMIKERVPPDIETEWVKLVAGTHRESIGRDKFPHLLKLLLEVKQRIEYKDADIRIQMQGRELHVDPQPTVTRGPLGRKIVLQWKCFPF